MPGLFPAAGADAGGAPGGPGCGCVPGRPGCDPCVGGTAAERALCLIYQAACCTDPCYRPRWTTLANAAFFVDGVRPVAQTRLGWNAGRNVAQPDRAEYFWARADGRGRGPAPIAPLRGPVRVQYDELVLVTEVASGNAGVQTTVPYRSMEAVGAAPPSAAGFGDVQIAAKSLLFDSGLFQAAFQTTTTIPAGSSRKGLGTGHASIEPGLIVGIKCGPDTFFQGQIAEWIPLGGDRDFEGGGLNYHASLNHVLARPVSDVQLIGTLEYSGYSFQDGLLSDPFTGSAKASGEAYAYVGGGLRLSFCDKLGLGVGARFAATDDHFARENVRVEFRFRY